jgi:glycosyltransferase involved in cell wall biosynthesis
MALPPKIGITAIVPVYNEAETIEEIVSRLERVPVIRQIVVVDDCSCDGTQAIVRRLVDEGRVLASFHERNRGKGAALRSGLPLVQEEYLAIQDADLEYDPRDFLKMVELIERYDAQVIYGSRFLGAGRTGMLWTHYLGNRGLTLLFNLMFQRWIGIDNDRFDVDPELTAKVVRAGYTIYESPVSYVGRPYLAGKKIKPRDAFTAVETLWRYRRWRPQPVAEHEVASAAR